MRTKEPIFDNTLRRVDLEVRGLCVINSLMDRCKYVCDFANCKIGNSALPISLKFFRVRESIFHLDQVK